MGLFTKKKPALSVDSTGLFNDIERGVVGLRMDLSEPPHATWMFQDHVQRAFQYNPEAGHALLCGACEGSIIGVWDDRHIVTVAGSRAGKGVSAIIPNLIFYRGSALVVDPKAENANVTALSRAQRLGQQVYVLDPFEIAAPHVAQFRARFNPLAILTPDSRNLVADASLIADACVIAGGRDAAHWDDTAAAFLKGLILHVVTWPDYQGRRDLVTTRQLVNEGRTVGDGKTELKGMAGLYWEMSQNDAADGVIRAQGVAMQDRPDSERGSILSTARRHTEFLDLPNLRAVLSGGHDFDLESLKTGYVTIYLCLPASRLGMCARWFRLFVNLTLEAMSRSLRKPPIPVLMVLDEFPILGHMRQIEDAAGQIAGYGVKLWPILQDLTQLKALYAERWETFLGNSGVIECWGNSDNTTLAWLAQRLGQSSLMVRRPGEVSTQQVRQGMTGESLNHELAPLLAPHEIAEKFGTNDPKRRKLIIMPGHKPMMLSRFVYYQDGLFDGKYQPLT